MTETTTPDVTQRIIQPGLQGLRRCFAARGCIKTPERLYLVEGTPGSARNALLTVLKFHVMAVARAAGPFRVGLLQYFLNPV